MKRKTGHLNAGLRRRVGTDTTCRSTRRNLLVVLAGLPLLITATAVRAQSKQGPAMIGWLETGTRNLSEHRLAAFKEAFAALGWKEGADYMLEERWADGRLARLQVLAEELAAKKPVLIVAAPSQAVAAATRAAPTTPIVQANGDPLAAKLVTNLARPGGMITGLSNVNTETYDKLIELLLLAAPKLRRVGFLQDATTTSDPVGSTQTVLRATKRLRVEARFAEVVRPEDIEGAITRLAKEGVQALILMSSSWFIAERRRIGKLTMEQRWPLVASQSEFAIDGGLISYGVDRTALYRRAAYYVDRILKGAKPGELPIELPTKFELIVNAKTATALGLTITPELRLRADRVIQ